MPVTDASTIAAELLNARRERRAIPTISSRHPGFTLDDAYRVEAAIGGARAEAGHRSMSALSTASDSSIGSSRPPKSRGRGSESSLSGLRRRSNENASLCAIRNSHAEKRAGSSSFRKF